MVRFFTASAMASFRSFAVSNDVSSNGAMPPATWHEVQRASISGEMSFSHVTWFEEDEPQPARSAPSANAGEKRMARV